MDQESLETGVKISRLFEQPSDAISFYCDFAQIFSTGHEVVMQFYETIPGPPGPGGGPPQTAKTRLRATITVSMTHGNTIGNLLLKQIGEGPAKGKS
ncbi:MAG: hypothetical protein HYY85_01855 [Deltaproteobacteria bacterium]|nr:hypothetical protein [Deltaproteobacteria bacterium]